MKAFPHQLYLPSGSLSTVAVDTVLAAADIYVYAFGGRGGLS